MLRALSIWYKTKFVAKILASKFGDRLALATKIGSQH